MSAASPRPSERYAAILATPVGQLGVVVVEAGLAELDFLPRTVSSLKPDSAIAELVVEQIQTYFRQANFQFSLPLAPRGTPFQCRVWAALAEIPFGQIVTYGQLAQTLGSSARAVGGGCRANPIPIVIPCHRVVAQSGLGGFMGQRAGDEYELKRQLLVREGVNR